MAARRVLAPEVWVRPLDPELVFWHPLGAVPHLDQQVLWSHGSLNLAGYLGFQLCQGGHGTAGAALEPLLERLLFDATEEGGLTVGPLRTLVAGLGRGV